MLGRNLKVHQRANPGELSTMLQPVSAPLPGCLIADHIRGPGSLWVSPDFADTLKGGQ